MWPNTFRQALVGLGSVENSIRKWDQKAESMVIYGPPGSGKTQIIRRVFPGAYIADPDQVNGPVARKTPPIFPIDSDFTAPVRVGPGQIFEMIEKPPPKLAQFCKVISTIDHGPTFAELHQLICLILTQTGRAAEIPRLQVLLPQNPTKKKVGDVRAELIRVEFALLHPGSFNGNYRCDDTSTTTFKTTRMEEIIRKSPPFGAMDGDRQIIDLYGQTHLDYTPTTEFFSTINSSGLDNIVEMSKFDDPTIDDEIDEIYDQFISNVAPNLTPLEYKSIYQKPTKNWQIDPVVPDHPDWSPPPWHDKSTWGSITYTKEELAEIKREIKDMPTGMNQSLMMKKFKELVKFNGLGSTK